MSLRTLTQAVSLPVETNWRGERTALRKQLLGGLLVKQAHHCMAKGEPWGGGGDFKQNLPCSLVDSLKVQRKNKTVILINFDPKLRQNTILYARRAYQ